MILKKTLPSFTLAMLLLALMVALRAAFSSFFAEIPLRLFDSYQRLQPRIAVQDSPTALIDIDDESLKRLGQWPWPRTQLAQLIEKLDKLGAKTLGFDIVFAEADRTSPERVLPLWPASPELNQLKALMRNLPDHDQIFAEAIGRSHVVTSFILTKDSDSAPPALKAGFAHAGDNPALFLPQFRGAVANLPEIEKNAKGNGSVNFIAEHDGIIRRVPLLFHYRDQVYPSLAAEALRLSQGASTYIVKSSGASGEDSFGARTGIVEVKIGKFAVPTDAQGRVWLYESAAPSSLIVPAWKVFEAPENSKLVEGKIVLIGASASGLKDLRSTAMFPVIAGTLIHANIIEQILSGEYLHRPDWAAGAEVVVTVALCVALALLLPQFGAAASALFGAIAVAGIFALSWFAFSRYRWLVDPVLPSLAASLIYLSGSLMNYLRTEKDKRQIRTAFGRYLSPSLVEKLAQDPGSLKLGGETKNMTVLFSDIRDFTSLSEKKSAAELTAFMNHYLTPMTDVILRNKGTIDKYIGDCIMAFWNAPLDDAGHAFNACQAALGMRKNLSRLNEKNRNEKIRIGIGINTGKCSVGNMGSEQRFDYSVLGDDVNLASRIENLTALYGLDIVIGPNSYEEVRDKFAFLELDLIQVKGKSHPVRIYGLLGEETLQKEATFQKLRENFTQMLQAYRTKNWDEAVSFLKNCEGILLPELELQKLFDLYANRIQGFRLLPPPADWDGAIISQTKRAGD